MKTLADFPTHAARYAAHSEPAEPGAVLFVRAPCCGRFTAADTIVDVRSVPGTIVGGGGYRAPQDHDWLCCGCQFRLIHDPRNDWTHSKLLSACGAPPDVVREYHARELAADAERADFAAGRAHRGEDAKQAALARLPVGIDPHRRTR